MKFSWRKKNWNNYWLKYRNRASSMRATFTLVLARFKEQKLICRTNIRLIWVAIVSKKSSTIRQFEDISRKMRATRWSRGYLSGEISCGHNWIFMDIVFDIVKKYFYIFILIIIVRRKIERNTRFQEFYFDRIIFCMIFVYQIWRIFE